MQFRPLICPMEEEKKRTQNCDIIDFILVISVLFIYLFIYFYLLVHSIAIVCEINVRKSKSILFKHKDVVVLVVFSQCWALEGFLLCNETSEMSKGVQLLIFARPMVDSSWAILQENKFWFLCSCKQRDNFTVTTVTKPKKNHINDNKTKQSTIKLKQQQMKLPQ